MIRNIIIGVVLTLYAVNITPAHAEGVKTISIEKFTKLFKTLDKIPAEDRTRINVNAVVECEGSPPETMVFEHISASGNTSLITDKKYGYLDVDAMKALPKTAQLNVSDRDDCGFSMTMTPKVDLATSMSAPDVRASFQQLRKAVLKIVPFFARPMIPRSLDMGFVLPEGTTANLIRNNGAVETLDYVVLRSGKSGVLISTDLLKDAQTLRFSQTPIEIIDMGRGVKGKT